jgi:hypothetical protein
MDERGIKYALVGATALAVHGYQRSTGDIDLGVALGSLKELQSLADGLRAALSDVVVEIALPDQEDPLGGVITMTTTSGEAQPVQIVNFINPLGTGDHPGRESILAAAPVEIGGRKVGVVDLLHLVALAEDWAALLPAVTTSRRVVAGRRVRRNADSANASGSSSGLAI